MYKLLKGYILKDKSKFFLIIISVLLSVMVIFANNTAKSSQAKFAINTIYTQSPKYQANINNIDAQGFEKIKNNENIKSYNLVKYFGSVVFKDNEYGLEEFNEEYFDNNKARLIKGNIPKNKNEIIISESICNKIEEFENKSLDSLIGKNINQRLIKKYKDKNNVEQIADERKSFKIVGIYKTPDEMKHYGDFDPIMIYKNFGTSCPFVTYNGGIKLKSGNKNFVDRVAKLSESLSETRENIEANYILERSLEENSTISNGYSDFDVATVVASAFLLFNVFNIMMKNMEKDLGMLRTIGMSKKQSFTFFALRNFISFIIGSVLGILFGCVLGEVMIKNFTYISTTIDATKAPLYVESKYILKSILTVGVTMFVVTLIPVRSIFTSSPIEMLNAVSPRRKFGKQQLRIKKYISKNTVSMQNSINNRKIRITTKLALKNTKRNIMFVLSTAIIVAIAGRGVVGIYIDDKSTLLEDNPLLIKLNNYNVNLEYNGGVATPINGYSENQVEKIRKINGVKEIYALKNNSAYLNLKSSELTKYYRNKNFMKNSDESSDIRVDLVSTSHKELSNYIKDNEDIFEEGRMFKEGCKIPEVIVYNKIYDDIQTYQPQAFKENLKVGDVINIKILTEENKHFEYKIVPVKVVGLLGVKWDKLTENEAFVPDVIMDTKDYKKVSGYITYDNIKIKTSDSNKDKTISAIKKIAGNNDIYKYKDRNTVIEDITQLRDQAMVQKLMQSSMLIVVAGINILFAILTSFVVRKREFATQRTLGMPIKDLKKQLLKEGLMYGVVSSIVGVLFIFQYGVSLCNFLRKMAMYKNIPYTGSLFIFPVVPTLIFIALVLSISALSVVVLFGKIDKENIIGGIRE